MGTQVDCQAKIRPFRPIGEDELQCELEAHKDSTHKAVLRDYAYPGSKTELSWDDDDRRTFRGDFVACPASCILPLNHRGNHAE